jgi:hypothetical protein
MGASQPVRDEHRQSETSHAVDKGNIHLFTLCPLVNIYREIFPMRAHNAVDN